MQATGYRDRKGREICEGDVCRIVFYDAPRKKPVTGVVRPYAGPGSRWGAKFAIYPQKGLPYSLQFKTGGKFGNTLAVEVVDNEKTPELEVRGLAPT